MSICSTSLLIARAQHVFVEGNCDLQPPPLQHDFALPLSLCHATQNVSQVAPFGLFIFALAICPLLPWALVLSPPHLTPHFPLGTTSPFHLAFRFAGTPLRLSSVVLCYGPMLPSPLFYSIIPLDWNLFLSELKSPWTLLSNVSSSSTVVPDTI